MLERREAVNRALDDLADGLATLSQSLRQLRAALEVEAAKEPSQPLANGADAEHITEEAPQPDYLGQPRETAILPSAEDAVRQWLNDRNVTVVRAAETEDPLTPLAVELGENFECLGPLHDSIRRCQSTGTSFRLSLEGRPPKYVQTCVEFAKKLSDIGMLTDYRYDTNTRIMRARCQTAGAVPAFFSGEWFELYIMERTNLILRELGRPFATLRNAQVTFPDETTSELDLLYLVEDQPLLIECKTGEYNQYLSRLRNINRHLRLPAERLLLVLLNAPVAEIIQTVRSLWKVTLAGRDSLADCIRAAVSSAPLPTEDAV